MGKSENSLVLASMFDIWYTIACYSQDVKSILCSFFVCFGIYVLSCWDLHFPMANLRYPARRKKNIFLAGSDLCSYTKRIQTIKIPKYPSKVSPLVPAAYKSPFLAGWPIQALPRLVSSIMLYPIKGAHVFRWNLTSHGKIPGVQLSIESLVLMLKSPSKSHICHG